MKGLVLAGGYGKRLRPYTQNLPKPLLEVAGQPLVTYPLLLFKRYGIENVVLCVGYLWEKIKGRLGDGKEYGISIRYAVEDTPLGTGGAIWNAFNQNMVEGDFFVLAYSDTIMKLNLSEMMENAIKHDCSVIGVVKPRNPYGVVEIKEWKGKIGEIVEFREKPIMQQYVNAGIYVIKKEQVAPFLKYPVEKQISFEKEVIPAMLEKGEKVLAYDITRENDWFWYPIDTCKEFENANGKDREAIERILEELSTPVNLRLI